MNTFIVPKLKSVEKFRSVNVICNSKGHGTVAYEYF